MFAVRTPKCTHFGLGSFHFARRYFGNRCFFLFLRLLRCFSSPGSRRIPMDSVYDDWGLLSQVSPFRYLRIIEYLLLPVAFRSLSRLSSALSAKASTLRSSSLNQRIERIILVQFRVHSVAHLSFVFVNYNHTFIWLLHSVNQFSLTNGLGCLLLVYQEICFLYSVFKVQEQQYNIAFVEMVRFELMTPCLQGRCSPNWAKPPKISLLGFSF